MNQGWVLGPLLFILYLTGIGAVLLDNEVEYRIYADDVQLFVVAHLDQVELAFKKLEKCIASIQKWIQ